jgi:putative hemolysin
MMTLGIGFILVLIFILILVNGFFAASEMALVSVNLTKMNHLANEGNKKAKLVLKVTEDSTRYLSTIQVAITLAGFMSSALAGARLSLNFVSFFESYGVTISQNLAVVIITFILSFVTLVLGELVPKKLALSNPNKFSLFSIYVVYAVMIVTKPFVWLLSKSTQGVLLIFRKNGSKDGEEVTEDDIRHLVLLGQVQGLYKDQERKMIENIFRFDDLKASMIKTPRTKVYGLDINLNKKTLIKKMVDSKYSRVIIFDKDIDHILGIIHVKDLLDAFSKQALDDIDIKSILRKPYYVPEDIKVNILFKRMQHTTEQFALLVDEHGGFEGIVTIEDMLEEIVGDIYDEHDQLPNQIKKIGEDKYIVKGDLTILDLNRYLNLKIDETSESFQTLSGLYIHLLGYLPTKKVNDVKKYDNISLKINRMKNKFIDELELTVKKPSESDVNK